MGRIEHFFSSYKRLGVFLFIAAVALSIPFTLSLLSQQQDIRQRAQIATVAEVNCSVTDQDLGLNPEEVNFLNLLNQYRQSQGLQPVTTSSKLSQMAAWMANDMAANDYLGHIDSLGRDSQPRAVACGVGNYNQEINAKAENDSSAQTALNGFKASPGHNSAMLNPQNVQAGIARAQNGNITFWAVEFGSSNDGTVAPIITLPPPTPTTAAPTPTFTPIPTQPLPTATPAPTSTPTGQPTATPTIEPTVSAVTNIAVSVKLPGIGSNTAAGENSNPVSGKTGQVSVGGNISNTTFTYRSQDASFKATVPVSSGSLNVKVRIDNSLWRDLGMVQIISNQTTSIPAFALVTGDASQDNRLDLADYNIFLSCYGTKACSQKQTADLNLDGKVDEKDLNIFYSGLANRQGD